MGLAYSTTTSTSDYGQGNLTTSGLSIAVGDLIAVSISCNTSSYNPTGISDSAGNTYTTQTRRDNTSMAMMVGYTVATTGGASVTITGEFESGGDNTRIVNVMVFTPDSGDTVSLEMSSYKESGWESSPWETGSAGNLTEADSVACAFFHNTSSKTWSNQEIPSGTAATNLSVDDDRTQMFYRIFTATENGIEGEVDVTTSSRYVAEILVFKSVASAGGGVAPTAALSGPLGGPLAGVF